MQLKPQASNLTNKQTNRPFGILGNFSQPHDIMTIVNQPRPDHVLPSPEIRPYWGLINHWFRLIRPAIKPWFLGRGTWPGGVGWQAMMKPTMVISIVAVFGSLPSLVTSRPSSSSTKDCWTPWKIDECSTLKRSHFNRKYIFQPSFFRGHSLVFRGVYIQNHNTNHHSVFHSVRSLGPLFSAGALLVLLLFWPHLWDGLLSPEVAHQQDPTKDPKYPWHPWEICLILKPYVSDATLKKLYMSVWKTFVAIKWFCC